MMRLPDRRGQQEGKRRDLVTVVDARVVEQPRQSGLAKRLHTAFLGGTDRRDTLGGGLVKQQDPAVGRLGHGQAQRHGRGFGGGRVGGGEVCHGPIPRGCLAAPQFGDHSEVFCMHDVQAAMRRDLEHAALQDGVGHGPSRNCHEPFEARDSLRDDPRDLIQPVGIVASHIHMKREIDGRLALGQRHAGVKLGLQGQAWVGLYLVDDCGRPAKRRRDGPRLERVVVAEGWPFRAHMDVSVDGAGQNIAPFAASTCCRPSSPCPSAAMRPSTTPTSPRKVPAPVKTVPSPDDQIVLHGPSPRFVEALGRCPPASDTIATGIRMIGRIQFGPPTAACHILEVAADF
jgi:hypothetical protein